MSAVAAAQSVPSASDPAKKSKGEKKEKKEKKDKGEEKIKLPPDATQDPFADNSAAYARETIERLRKPDISMASKQGTSRQPSFEEYKAMEQMQAEDPKNTALEIFKKKLLKRVIPFPLNPGGLFTKAHSVPVPLYVYRRTSGSPLPFYASVSVMNAPSKRIPKPDGSSFTNEKVYAYPPANIEGHSIEAWQWLIHSNRPHYKLDTDNCVGESYLNFGIKWFGGEPEYDTALAEVAASHRWFGLELSELTRDSARLNESPLSRNIQPGKRSALVEYRHSSFMRVSHVTEELRGGETWPNFSLMYGGPTQPQGLSPHHGALQRYKKKGGLYDVDKGPVTSALAQKESLLALELSTVTNLIDRCNSIMKHWTLGGFGYKSPSEDGALAYNKELDEYVNQAVSGDAVLSCLVGDHGITALNKVVTGLVEFRNKILRELETLGEPGSISASYIGFQADVTPNTNIYKVNTISTMSAPTTGEEEKKSSSVPLSLHFPHAVLGGCPTVPGDKTQASVKPLSHSTTKAGAMISGQSRNNGHIAKAHKILTGALTRAHKKAIFGEGKFGKDKGSYFYPAVKVFVKPVLKVKTTWAYDQLVSSISDEEDGPVVNGVPDECWSPQYTFSFRYEATNVIVNLEPNEYVMPLGSAKTQLPIPVQYTVEGLGKVIQPAPSDFTATALECTKFIKSKAQLTDNWHEAQYDSAVWNVIMHPEGGKKNSMEHMPPDLIDSEAVSAAEKKKGQQAAKRKSQPKPLGPMENLGMDAYGEHDLIPSISQDPNPIHDADMAELFGDGPSSSYTDIQNGAGQNGALKSNGNAGPAAMELDNPLDKEELSSDDEEAQVTPQKPVTKPKAKAPARRNKRKSTEPAKFKAVTKKSAAAAKKAKTGLLASA